MNSVELHKIRNNIINLKKGIFDNDKLFVEFINFLTKEIDRIHMIEHNEAISFEEMKNILKEEEVKL